VTRGTAQCLHRYGLMDTAKSAKVSATGVGDGAGDEAEAAEFFSGVTMNARYAATLALDDIPRFP